MHPRGAIALLFLAIGLGGCATVGSGTSGEGDALASESAEQDVASGGRILGVTLSADLRSDGTTIVSIEYRLETYDPSAPIPLRGLAYDNRVPEDFLATYEGGAAAVEWLPVDLPSLRGRVLPGESGVVADAVSPAPVGSASPVVGRAPVERSVTFQYRVGAGSGSRAGAAHDARLPVVLVDWPPAAAPEGFFQATISVPPGMEIVERFPTVPLRPARAEEGEGIVRMSLPAVPSVLRLRMASGATGPRFATRVDLAVIALLLLLGAIAWRGFRATEQP